MPFGVNRENWYQGLSWPSVVKAVDGVYTGTTAAALWTPASGKKVRLLGGMIQVFVATVLAGNETAGDYVAIYDHAVTRPILVDALVTVDTVPGSRFFGTAQGNTTFTTAATEFTTAQPLPPFRFDIPGGYLSSAADNIIRFGLLGSDDSALEDVSTGQIRCCGVLWGHEE